MVRHRHVYQLRATTRSMRARNTGGLCASSTSFRRTWNVDASVSELERDSEQIARLVERARGRSQLAGRAVQRSSAVGRHRAADDSSELARCGF